ncbi:MAG: FtsQ-type POTRA domain-containing protein [Nitrospirae bacterium]|nr:FtsQ-type POTRA domain-containing protein [Nitrospirota bacterium]
MRDYKNVNVPRSYRGSSNRSTVKRAIVGRAAGRARTGGTGVKRVALQIITIVMIAAGGLLAWKAYQTLLHAEMFQIAGVDVQGAKQISEADLREIAGVFKGKNIFRVDLETPVMRARANPWVKDARIYRRLPNRISMVVTERVAFALLDTGDGMYVMDNEGVVINRIAKENASVWQLPVVAVKQSRVRPGEQVTYEGVAESLTLIAEIAERGGWRMREVTIKAGSPETLSILYADHEFKIGTGNYPEKLRRLAEILSDGTQRGMEISYVDLRPERQAAVMVKNSRVQGTGTRVKGKKI